MSRVSVFDGLSAFPVTPADAEGIISVDRLHTLVSRIARPGVSSIGVLGSTGSYAYLERTQRARAISAAVKAAGSVPVIAGIGALRTSDVVKHAEDAARAGARGLLLAPMSYLPLTDDEVFGLARDVSAAANLPICIYNNPGTTHFTVSEPLLRRLATISGVQAVKNPAPPDGDFAGQVARLSPVLPTGFSLGYSGDATIAGALGGGAYAWYSVLAGTCPETCIALWSARTNPNELRLLNERLEPVWDVFARLGGIRVIHEIVPLLGLGRSDLPLPLLPLGEQSRSEVIAAFTAAGLIGDTTI